MKRTYSCTTNVIIILTIDAMNIPCCPLQAIFRIEEDDEGECTISGQNTLKSVHLMINCKEECILKPTKCNVTQIALLATFYIVRLCESYGLSIRIIGNVVCADIIHTLSKASPWYYPQKSSNMQYDYDFIGNT